MGLEGDAREVGRGGEVYVCGGVFVASITLVLMDLLWRNGNLSRSGQVKYIKGKIVFTTLTNVSHQRY